MSGLANSVHRSPFGLVHIGWISSKVQAVSQAFFKAGSSRDVGRLLTGLTKVAVKEEPVEHCCVHPTAVSKAQPSHSRRPSDASQDLLA